MFLESVVVDMTGKFVSTDSVRFEVDNHLFEISNQITLQAEGFYSVESVLYEVTVYDFILFTHEMKNELSFEIHKCDSERQLQDRVDQQLGTLKEYVSKVVHIPEINISLSSSMDPA